MKKSALVLLLLLVSTSITAQKKEKIKGSKTVTIESKEIGNFNAIEVEDNIEVYLEKGTKNEIKIEADENLHDIITTELRDNTLRIYTTKNAGSYKKLVVRITYTPDLKKVTAKNEAVINAIEQLELDTVEFDALDYSKLFLNANCTQFILKSNDKTKVELNLKAVNTQVELSKNATLKALLTTTDLKCDGYQKTIATLEGDISNATIRLDNNAILSGKKLTTKKADVTLEGYTTCSITAETNLILDASDQSEMTFLGEPKIEIRAFTGESKLIKKLK
ncbi:GIN domain-containing protein [Flavobacterium restrictum]|uniref:DUF2807 domain-containing protein n=1 Tax=Flavobacterium restrictum TaxID=2594428 RepID=A0A553E2F3_9FLAO|nr:DUF2807 domain-containing protein [Flavobacterium restrictum]TRX39170.1 DUF2807 domain-containing protein [Flavobacterium restrictum]